MSHPRKFTAVMFASLCASGAFSAFGAEVEHICENELACIEELYKDKQYDPLDFAAVKLIVGGEDSLSFNDNIFRAAGDEESDIINRFSPRVSVESNLDRHFWEMELEAENGIYFSNSENNYTDFSALGNGRYDVNQELALSAAGGYVLDHVGIGSFVDDPGVRNDEPTPFHTASAHAALDYLPAGNPIHINVGGGADFINYENVSRRGGGIDIQDDRDRTEYGGTALLGYRVGPGNEVYLKTAHEKWDHDERIDSSALSTRDSSQHRYLVGYRSDPGKGGPLRYDVAVGYLEQEYDANRLPNVDTLDFYASADWKINPVNNLRLRLSRDVRDAYSNQRSAYLRTQARLNYEHEYNEALSLGAGASYTNNDFETLPGVALDREDDVYGMHIWSAYEFVENLEANLYYTYTERDSNDPIADYDANVIGVALSYKH